jgi:precorrin-2/cobalt-factor-2 C20-methyltransferase
MEKKGTLYGIGVGPGDPELITMRAHNILTNVPVIFVPQKDDKSESLALSIVNNYVDVTRQQIIGLIFPMSKDKAVLAKYWENAAQRIWEHVSNGNDCAFINLGDPLTYGTFIYVLNEIQKRHPDTAVEIVPGISSINAAASRALLPLAVNKDQIAIIAGYDNEDFIKHSLKHFNTLIFLKIHNNFERLLAIIEELDLVDNCIYISHCTMSQEEIIKDIRNLKNRRLDYFSLLLVRR